jgi:hypothetical protein
MREGLEQDRSAVSRNRFPKPISPHRSIVLALQQETNDWNNEAVEALGEKPNGFCQKAHINESSTPTGLPVALTDEKVAALDLTHRKTASNSSTSSDFVTIMITNTTLDN